jgi:hypothetical protein
MRNFSFKWPQDEIGLSCDLTYQFAAMPSSDMMNDFARVVSFPPNEAIVAL